jgi:hypothetical protein
MALASNSHLDDPFWLLTFDPGQSEERKNLSWPIPKIVTVQVDCEG